MKILVIWGMPLFEKNAQTTCLLEKLENLKKLHNEVIYLAPKIPLILWKSRLINDVLLLALYQIPFFFHIFWTIIRFRPDIIQSSSPLVLPSLILAKLFKIPHIVEAHGILYEDAAMTNNSQLMISLLNKFEGISYSNSDRILANAEGTKIYIENEFNIDSKKVIVLPNGANVDLFKPIKVSKSELGLSNEHDYVCFVGNIAPWQGIEYLIDSAVLILKDYPLTRFLIVGDGPIRQNLINKTNALQIGDKFIFTGALPYENIPKLINASEICVAPFVKWKNNKMSPLKIFEYMACGKPVITSDIKGSGDIIKESKSGIALNSEDSHKMAYSIIKLLNNKKLCDEMGRNGRNFVLKDYSWYKITKEMNKIYSELL